METRGVSDFWGARKRRAARSWLDWRVTRALARRQRSAAEARLHAHAAHVCGVDVTPAEVPSLASSHDIDMNLFEQKMRLLSFESAASSKVTPCALPLFCAVSVILMLPQAVLTFEECAAHMDTKVEDVEKWIVRVVSSGIADCKIIQQVGIPDRLRYFVRRARAAMPERVHD
jgi:hypothetical protein